MRSLHFLLLIVLLLLSAYVGIGLDVTYSFPYISLARDNANFPFLLVAILGFAVLAFREQLNKLIEDRGITISKEGVRIHTPDPSTDPIKGSVRDNFLYLGIYYKSLSKRSSGDRAIEFAETAFQFFSAADRIDSSMTSAFRSMECWALKGFGGENDDHKGYYSTLRKWFDRSLHEADTQRDKLQGRRKFSEWVLAQRENRRKRKSDGEYVFEKQLAASLRKIDF